MITRIYCTWFCQNKVNDSVDDSENILDWGRRVHWQLWGYQTRVSSGTKRPEHSPINVVRWRGGGAQFMVTTEVLMSSSTLVSNWHTVQHQAGLSINCINNDTIMHCAWVYHGDWLRMKSTLYTNCQHTKSVTFTYHIYQSACFSCCDGKSDEVERGKTVCQCLE